MTPDRLAQRLAAAGCLEAADEARLLRASATGPELELLVRRREAGEPLAWLIGRAVFAGVQLVVRPGVFVPRPHTEGLALRAAELLPHDGLAADLCTGSGAIAALLRARHPGARVVASDVSLDAVACARQNGVEAFAGSLDEPLPGDMAGRCDVVTCCPPYVPSDHIPLLPRDVVAHEPLDALDGGRDGLDITRRAIEAAGRLLRPGGVVLIELGGDQAAAVSAAL